MRVLIVNVKFVHVLLYGINSDASKREIIILLSGLDTARKDLRFSLSRQRVSRGQCMFRASIVMHVVHTQRTRVPLGSWALAGRGVGCAGGVAWGSVGSPRMGSGDCCSGSPGLACVCVCVCVCFVCVPSHA